MEDSLTAVPVAAASARAASSITLFTRQIFVLLPWSTPGSLPPPIPGPRPPEPPVPVSSPVSRYPHLSYFAATSLSIRPSPFPTDSAVSFHPAARPSRPILIRYASQPLCIRGTLQPNHRPASSLDFPNENLPKICNSYGGIG